MIQVHPSQYTPSSSQYTLSSSQYTPCHVGDWTTRHQTRLLWLSILISFKYLLYVILQCIKNAFMMETLFCECLLPSSNPRNVFFSWGCNLIYLFIVAAVTVVPICLHHCYQLLRNSNSSINELLHAVYMLYTHWFWWRLKLKFLLIITAATLLFLSAAICNKKSSVS